MTCPQIIWPVPNNNELLHVLATTFRESPFSTRVTLQVIGGKLLANAPYAVLHPDNYHGSALKIIFPANRLPDIEIELKTLQLHYGPPQTLDTYIQLERGLRYSIVWRLSPMWNQVGDKLVMGNEFLEGKENSHWFVEFNISVCPQIVLTITNSGMIRLRPITMEMLFPETREQRSARADLDRQLSDGIIVTCVAHPCFVLPSLSRAKIIAVAQKPFGIIDTRQKMSSYWIGRYGYRLDSCLSAPGSFYCVVVFPGGSRFLYPRCCLMLDQGSVFHCHYNQRVLEHFHRNISRVLADFIPLKGFSEVIRRSQFFDSAESEKCEP